MEETTTRDECAPAQTLEQLATQLGRPEKSLAPFRGLPASDVTRLSVALTGAVAHQQQALLETRSALLRPFIAPLFRRLRDAVYERLFTVDQRLFHRLARALSWLPTFAVIWMAQRFHPVLVARVAGQLPARRAAKVCQGLPVDFLADVAVELDPRGARELIRRLPVETIRDVAVELVRRQDHLTLDRFVDFVSDESILMILDVIHDDALLLRLGGFTESKNRLDHLVQLLPEPRVRNILALARDETGDLPVHVLMILTEVSFGLKRRLGDLLAELPEAVLNALIRTAQREGLWAELLLDIVARMPSHKQEEFARIACRLGEVDAGLRRRIAARAAAYGFGAAFPAAA